MSFPRKRRHLLVVCLVLAAVLYRGLIPAGFMPAMGDAAHPGAQLVICPHGEMGMMHSHAGDGANGDSVEQCPFGAAAGPALPSVQLVFLFDPGPLQARTDLRAVPNQGASPYLQPPVRGPPVFS